jgi:GT2 family glycosyltransferase
VSGLISLKEVLDTHRKTHSTMNIAVLITSFNRVAVTLRGLTGLYEAIKNQNMALFEIFLVDDGSPDATGALVKEQFPDVHVIAGTGHLYWNRGMCRAYEHAKAARPFDAYLLFNDDVELMSNALQKMLSVYSSLNSNAPSVVIGPMCAKATLETTYCGFVSTAKYRPITFERVLPDGRVRECDTFNGNCVLVPARAMDDVGGLYPAYHHSFGDIDLGLMLRKRGCKSYLLPDHIGFCELNIPKPAPPFIKRLRGMFYPPHPVSDQIHLSFRRYSWPIATVIAAAQVVKRLSEVLMPHGN